MPLTIRQLHPVFAGEVTGIDISKPLTPADVAAIEAGMDKYAVLVFPGQQLTDEQQMAFTVNFGPIEDARGGNVTKPQDKRLVTGMNDVSNLGKDGKPLARDSRQRLFNIGNMLWHSDSSFRPIPAKYSLLSARIVNKKGGNTEFADMRAAYDALDEDTKARGRGPRVRALPDVLARLAGLPRLHRGGEGDVQAGAPAPGALSSRDGPQVALPVLARRRHPRHADARGAHAAARPQRARDAAEVRLRAQVDAPRPRHLGQPPDHAPRAPLR